MEPLDFIKLAALLGTGAVTLIGGWVLVKANQAQFRKELDANSKNDEVQWRIVDDLNLMVKRQGDRLEVLSGMLRPDKVEAEITAKVERDKDIEFLRRDVDEMRPNVRCRACEKGD